MDITTSIDAALLLCAGLGTRMGIIGKQLPKPLWPLFEETILDIQIRYLKSLKINKIFINTHYLDDQIKKHIQQHNHENIVILHEPILLKSGGTIHKLLESYGKKFPKILVINADQFYFPSISAWKEAIEAANRHTAVLFPLSCSLQDGYNQLVIKNNLLCDIIPLQNISKENSQSYITFSGMCIINMGKLSPTPGISNFWDTVANYKTDQIYVTNNHTYSYYDFGTAKKYFETCFKILSEIKLKTGMFYKLGMTHMGSSCNEIKENSGNIINFSNQSFSNTNHSKAIILKARQKIVIDTPGLYYNEILDKLK